VKPVGRGTGRASAGVRSLIRGLDLLQALNRIGECPVATLCGDTGLPRATVYRLLDTLEEEGYVQRDRRSGRVRLRYAVRSLADGYGDEEWLTHAAMPHMQELADSLVWPIAIATLNGDTMHVRASTSLSSPLALDRVPAGYRVPILESAIGMACFAFSNARVRKETLRLLARTIGRDAALARTSAALDESVERVRRAGYATRIRGFNPRTSSLAVPILRDATSIAGLNISWHHAALTTREALREFLPRLKIAARRIEVAAMQIAPASHQADRRPESL